MSSTQMDLSPHEINRKQDITSWPEGDITGLTARNQNRYQRRKSAIIDYFQSELPVEEISSRHHLPQSDALETLARQCLMHHEDGRLWGFRALVPGAKVADCPAPVDLSPVQLDLLSLEVADEDEDTVEREAVHLNGTRDMPETPVPEIEKSEAAAPGAEVNSEEQESSEEENRAASQRVEAESAEEEAEQEEFPGQQESEETREVEQEEFPARQESEETGAEEEEGEQKEFPTAESAVKERAVPEEDARPVESDEPVEEAAERGVQPAAEEAGTVESNRPGMADEVVSEASTPVVEVEEAAGEDEEESHTQELVGEANEDAGEDEAQEVRSEEADQGEEPGQEVRGEENEREEPGQGIEDEESDGEEPEQEVRGEEGEEESTTQKLVREDRVEEGAEEGAASQADDEQSEMAERDTVEVAAIEEEARRDRVSAADTIVVPAAMLDALERSDLEADLAEAETVKTSAVSLRARANGHGVLTPEEQQELTLPGDLAPQDEEVRATRELSERRRDGQQLSTARDSQTPTQPLVEEGRYRVTGSQAALKHSMLRRWGKLGRQRKHQRLVRIISAAVIAAILVGLAIPLGVALVGYNTYNNIKGVASDGVNNLLALQALMPANKNDIASILNAQKLATAKDQLNKAETDFLQLQDMVNRPDIQSLLQQFAPQYSGKLDMARRLVTVALDVSRMGRELIGVAQLGASILHGGSLLSSSSNKPLITADNINTIEAALVHAQYYIGDIQGQMSQVSLAQIPFGTSAQKARLTKYLGLLPQIQGTVSQVQGLVGPVAWLLGVGSTRRFLIQTLDRAELRPSGGFEGQYGVVTVSNGRLGPVGLTDIARLDYAENGNELGNRPPAQYKWMDFGNFGVRDANLSADFPTTAKMVMQLFQLEGGGPVDGDIQITPVVIEQLLQMTGPLYVKDYKETITAQNLEDKLHLYQQNYNYISIEAAKTGQYTHQTRKAFTSLVGQMLLDRAKRLSTTQLIAFSKILLKDLKSRDVQVYFTNPVAEQWLTQNGYSGAMPRFTNGTDGFMVVQANISISKASQYVHSTFNDQVTLNADGSATHQLTITLAYNQRGPVYGYDTYADYVRVYAPANAQFLDGYGFDSGRALCTPSGKEKKGGGSGGGGSGTGTGKTSGCSQYNTSFPSNGYRYCPSGVYTLGYDGMIAKPFPIDSLGGPTATSSDLPGYRMWGGLTLTPKNCTTTLTLSWIVPRVVQNTPGKPPYQMVVGHQAGWPVTAQISVDASALKGVKNFSFNQAINVDTLVALPARPLPPSQQKPTTPTPAVTPTATPKKP